MNVKIKMYMDAEMGTDTDIYTVMDMDAVTDINTVTSIDTVTDLDMDTQVPTRTWISSLDLGSLQIWQHSVKFELDLETKMFSQNRKLAKVLEKVSGSVNVSACKS
jgi:hypothetical protein